MSPPADPLPTALPRERRTVGRVKAHSRTRKPQRKVRKWFLTSVLVPLLCAAIAAATSIAVVEIPRTSQTDSPDSVCSRYEKYVINPLAKSDPAAVLKLLESGSPIDRACGLSP